ncbi:MAG: sigma-70 family RNA polymerase sigma factor [Oscillospiraceae bacterium]|nr:sigma-70 family RNA polymerase sigma factor [Oscillospiraceae bacterium]
MYSDDRTIIQQIAARDERAIEAMAAAYGTVCRRIAKNILGNAADAEEVCNEALFRAWNAIPAHPPVHLQAYLITLTRRIAFDLLKTNNRFKRGGGDVPLALEELAECVAAPDSVEAAIDRSTLKAEIDRFLDRLSAEKRRIFIERYTMLMPTAEIAAAHGMQENAVRMALCRMRKALRQTLEKEGYL